MTNISTHASGAIWWSNLQLMQVAPSGGQICILCKWIVRCMWGILKIDIGLHRGSSLRQSWMPVLFSVTRHLQSSRSVKLQKKLNIIATAASRPHSVLGKLIPPKYFWPMKTTNEDQSKVWFESHICWSLSGPPFEPILKSLEESGPYHPHPDHGNINNWVAAWWLLTKSRQWKVVGSNDV